MRHREALGHGFAADPERMTRNQDALARRAKQAMGHVAGIDSAACLAAMANALGQPHGFGDRGLEHRVKQLDDEFLRRVVVIVNDDLDVGGARACRFVRHFSSCRAGDVIDGGGRALFVSTVLRISAGAEYRWRDNRVAPFCYL